MIPNRLFVSVVILTRHAKRDDCAYRLKQSSGHSHVDIYNVRCFNCHLKTKVTMSLFQEWT